MVLRLLLFGAPQLQRDGKTVAMDTRKAIALLAYLVSARDTHDRDLLSSLLWPDSGQAKARGSLRRTLSTLRSAVGGGVIASSRDQIGLEDDPPLQVDVWQFVSLLDSVHTHSHPQGPICATCLQRLEEAGALYRGHFMEGFSLKDSHEFDDWQYFEGDRLKRRYAAALEQMVAWKTLAEDYEAAILDGQKWSALDRLHEPAHQQLMRVHALRGDRAAALRQYRLCTRILEEELGVPPLPETQELYRRILEGEHLPRRESLIRSGGGQLRRASARDKPLLVGRDRELRAIHAALQASLAGGQVVGLVGEAGIGKTRLAEEFIAQSGEAAPAAIRCRGHRWEDHRPYSTLVEGLRSAIHLPGAERKLAGVPGHWLGEAARLLPELLSLPLLARPSPYPEGPGAQGRIFEALRQVIVALSGGAGPGILFLDDLNWADQASLDFVGFLVRNIGEAKLLLILCWRDIEDANSGVLQAILREAEREGLGRILQLGRLSPEEVRTLSRAHPHAPEQFHKDLFEISEGLPLFVVEYLALAEEIERRRPGDWPIPQSILDLERTRLATLSETSLQILSTAAVIGRSFELVALRSASGRAEAEVVAGLEQLLAHRLITESTEGGLALYDFTHGVLREVVYREISLARRRLLHKRVAQALIDAGRREGETGDQVALIAHHFNMAGEAQAAAGYFARAGQNARQVYANHEALEHFQAALALGHPEKDSLHEAIGDLLTLQGEYASAISSYEAAAAQANGRVVPRLEHKLGNLHQRLGRWESAIAHYQSSLGSLEKDGTDRLRAAILADLAYCVHRSGDPEKARATAQEALESSMAGGHRAETARAENILAILDRSQAHLSEAQRHLEACLRITAGEPELASAEIAALNNLSFVQREKGAIREAIANTDQALALCRKVGDRHREAALLNNLADLHHELGQDDESMKYLRQAVVIFSDIGIDKDSYSPEVWMLADW